MDHESTGDDRGSGGEPPRPTGASQEDEVTSPWDEEMCLTLQRQIEAPKDETPVEENDSEDGSEEEKADNNPPRVDVIHVAAFCEPREALSLETLGMGEFKTERREFTFHISVDKLLLENLTDGAIVCQARQLLSELKVIRNDKTPGARRAIVFVAYDLGALVVKAALAIAGTERIYYDIFFNTGRIVFSGCPQRAPDLHTLEAALIAFLGEKRDPSWLSYLTAPAISNLARAVLDTTEEFVCSKIALRTRVISLYAGTRFNFLPPAFSRNIATLGLPSEYPIEEASEDQKKKDEEFKRFPFLDVYMMDDPQAWIPHNDWIPWEKTMLALSPPPRMSDYLPALECDSAVIEHPVYREWIDNSGVGILYLHGSSSQQTRKIAEQIAWRRRMFQKTDSDNDERIVSFSFDRRDPLRNTIRSMLASIFTQAHLGRRSGFVNRCWNTLQDHLVFQGGWSDRSMIANLRSFGYQLSDAILLLHGFDECLPESRVEFLNYLQAISVESEERFKLIITSEQPHVLLKELENWQQIDVDSLHDSPPPLERVENPQEIIPYTVYRAVPPESAKHVQELLARLAPMTPENFELVITLLRAQTKWPQALSPRCFGRLVHLLKIITATDSPAQILDKVLRYHMRIRGFSWVFSWILCSARPLTLRELATLLSYHIDETDEESKRPRQIPENWRAKEYENQIWDWLQGIADLDHGQVKLTSQVRDIISETGSTIERFVWRPLVSDGYVNITKFCFEELLDEDNIRHLESLFENYEGNPDKTSRHQAAPPLLPDGENPLFYCVQFLAHHLSRCPKNLLPLATTSTRDFLRSKGSVTWAKVYWAMSNPFSRSHRPFDSAVPVLAGFGVLEFGDIKGDETEASQCLIAAVDGRQTRFVEQSLQKSNYSVSTLLGALVVAVRTNDEDMAVKLAERMLALWSKAEAEKDWPPLLIWTTAWLGMPRLATLLLEHGASPDPPNGPDGEVKNVPNALYLAANLGNVETAKLLLQNGARTDLLRENTFNFVNSATHYPDLMDLFLEKNSQGLNADFKVSPLYTATLAGVWRIIPKLVENKLDLTTRLSDPPGAEQQVTPLVCACLYRNYRTAEALLENGADANALGPWLPLWISAVWTGTKETTAVLLRHGADPNHDELPLPLLADLIDSVEDVDRILDIAQNLLANDPPVQINKQSVGGNTPLMYACRKGYMPVIKWLLENGADVNILDHDKQSALYWAIAQGHVSVVQELLKHRPALDIIDGFDGTPLANALEHPEIVRLLLDHGADPNLANKREQTLINSAAWAGKVEVVKMLIERGVDIHHRDTWGFSPILDAVGYARSLEMTMLLLDNGANLRDIIIGGGSGVLHLAVSGSPEILRKLLEFGKLLDLNQRNDNEETPLLYARENANTDSIALLVNAGADITIQENLGNTALHNSIHHDLPQMRDLLLKQPEVDVNCFNPRSGAALHLACRSAQADSVNILIEHGADVNLITPSCMNRTPLISALLPMRSAIQRSSDFDQIVRTLVKNGAEVRAKVPGTFFTPLAAACYGSSTNTINFLLDEGASPDEVDPLSGRRHIHFAAANGIDNFQAILLSYRGDRLAADHYGKNALHWAAQNGHARTVEYILSKLPSDSDRRRAVDQADCDGWTPLCWAIPAMTDDAPLSLQSESKNYPMTIDILVQNGASASVEFRLGEETLTPMVLAKRCDSSEEVIEALQKGIASTSDTSPNSESTSPIAKYTQRKTGCDICLGEVYGKQYSCGTCLDYVMCTKCWPLADKFHTKEILADGQGHPLRLKDDQPEFQPVEATPEGEGNQDGEQNSPNQNPDPVPEADNEDEERQVGQDRAGSEELQEMVLDDDAFSVIY